jgi:hypothetical protein
MTTETHPDAWLADLAAQSLRVLPGLADDLVDRMWDATYDPAGPVPKDDLWRSCHDNLGNMLSALRGAGPTPATLLASARATGTRRAQQRCPLEWVLRAWHDGGEIMWQDLASRAGAEHPEDLHHLVRYASDVWGVTDRFSVEMAATYQRVEEHLLGTVDYHLADVLDALLDGRSDLITSDTARALHLDTSNRYAVAVAEDTSSYHGSVRVLARALERHGIPSTWHLRMGAHVGIVPTHDATPDQVAAILRLPAAGRIGLSPTFTSLSQVPTGYRMATLAMTALPPEGAAVTTLDRCLPEALLLDAPDLSRRLVATTLGPILDLPAGESDDLLRTIDAWVGSLGSSLRAARALYCHRNTVLNRLHRI